MSNQFICGFVLHFKDGGSPEATVLGGGTQEECENIGRLLPGVAYSGERPLDRAEFVIGKQNVPRGQWEVSQLKTKRVGDHD